MAELREDWRIDALTAEVERRRPEKDCRRYSYGKLVADTTKEERTQIAERYLQTGGKVSAGRYKETDDERDLKKAVKTEEA